VSLNRSLALTCAERSENRDDLASVRVARVRLCRGRARGKRADRLSSYTQMREKRGGPVMSRPSTLNQRVGGSSPPRPTNRIGHFGIAGVPDFAFQARLVPNLVPDRAGNAFGCRCDRASDAIQQIHPAPPTARDPSGVVAKCRRGIGVPELRAGVSYRRASCKQQRGIGVAQVVEPERG